MQSIVEFDPWHMYTVSLEQMYNEKRANAAVRVMIITARGRFGGRDWLSPSIILCARASPASTMPQFFGIEIPKGQVRARV
jgi:hypothetical protein